MIDITMLPYDLQRTVHGLYVTGLRTRLRRWYVTKILCELSMLCNDDTSARDYLLDWMTHMVQHPSTKPGCAVMLIGGAPGTFVDLSCPGWSQRLKRMTGYTHAGHKATGCNDGGFAR